MMHVYENNVIEWVVAESVDDAKKVLREHYQNWDCGDEIDLDFKQTPDERVLTRDECRGDAVRKTAADWAKEVGRGFLMTTEY